MNSTNFELNDFFFDLPDELIAQFPTEKRDESKLFVLNKQTGDHVNSKFKNLADFIKPGDILVFNDARVISARVYFQRKSGAIIEVILTNKIDEKKWLIICNRTKRIREGEELVARKNNDIKILIQKRAGEYFEIQSNVELTDDLLQKIGEIPLPPYVRRKATEDDYLRYQTVYADKSGAVAAPTAGLHFTQELMNTLKKTGADLQFLTLMVSWGTFQPVREKNLSLHRMHKEAFVLSEETAQSLNHGRNEGRRIIAVGTTSLRVLESTYRNGANEPGTGETDIFIYPPYTIKSIDGLITNFHTPYSTLLMLVSAFAGYETIMASYKKAVELKYRFFSYGDAMLII